VLSVIDVLDSPFILNGLAEVAATIPYVEHAAVAELNEGVQPEEG